MASATSDRNVNMLLPEQVDLKKLYPLPDRVTLPKGKNGKYATVPTAIDSKQSPLAFWLLGVECRGISTAPYPSYHEGAEVFPPQTTVEMPKVGLERQIVNDTAAHAKRCIISVTDKVWPGKGFTAEDLNTKMGLNMTPVIKPYVPKKAESGDAPGAQSGASSAPGKKPAPKTSDTRVRFGAKTADGKSADGKAAQGPKEYKTDRWFLTFHENEELRDLIDLDGNPLQFDDKRWFMSEEDLQRDPKMSKRFKADILVELRDLLVHQSEKTCQPKYVPRRMVIYTNELRVTPKTVLPPHSRRVGSNSAPPQQQSDAQRHHGGGGGGGGGGGDGMEMDQPGQGDGDQRMEDEALPGGGASSYLQAKKRTRGGAGGNAGPLAEDGNPSAST